MLRLAQAASSENFGAYGTPPNQRRTGVTSYAPWGNRDGELNIVPFYGGWAAVFRPKDEKKAEKIAWLAEGAVDNGSYIGYGQGSLASDGGKYHREGVFDALFQMSEPDTRMIRNLANCDCSSLAGACTYFSGIYEPKLRTMWTGNEAEILMRTNEFIKLTDPLLLEIGTGLRRGDILLKPGHTAIAIDTDDHADSTPARIADCYQCNMRTGPGVDYKIMNVLNEGMIVYILSTAWDEDGDEWKKVQFGGNIGYIAAKYVKTMPSASEVTGDVWLRIGPGKTYDSIIVIPKGTPECYLTGSSKKVLLTTWYECIYGGHRGWASGKYIKP